MCCGRWGCSPGNVRISLPVGTAEEDVERFLAVLPGVVRSVRERLGVGDAAGAPAEPVPEAAPDSGAGVDTLVVDALGKRCPIPVIELAKVIGKVPVGGVVTVLSDDEAARLDVPAWCEMRGQGYEGAHPADGGTAYRVRRVS